MLDSSAGFLGQVPAQRGTRRCGRVSVGLGGGDASFLSLFLHLFVSWPSAVLTESQMIHLTAVHGAIGLVAHLRAKILELWVVLADLGSAHF